MIGRILVLAVKTYQLTLSPLFCNGSCRFTPGCSAYAVESITRHGAVKGSWLTLTRLCRCHPWGGHGFDPVP
jgi:putative membrane protein insertion efficiency factor